MNEDNGLLSEQEMIDAAISACESGEWGEWLAWLKERQVVQVREVPRPDAGMSEAYTHSCGGRRLTTVFQIMPPTMMVGAHFAADA